jgi:release factor glutamine methyltransferase
MLMDRATLEGDAAAAFGRLLERRIGGECAAYLLGRKEFWGLDFAVAPEVLVPRPETELLVEAALAALPSAAPAEDAAPPLLLDLCTGSGAAAIALKHERPFLEVYATDISPGALAIARGNAARLLGDAGAVQFLLGDLFEPVPPLRFDLIVANPPYVPSAAIPNLSREVRGEPLLALDGGEDGLDLARRHREDAPAVRESRGRRLMEADPRQMPSLVRILSKKGLRDVRLHRDLSGFDRALEAAMPPEDNGNSGCNS